MNLLTKAGYRVSHFIIASIIDWLLQAVSIDKQSQKGHSGELGIVYKGHIVKDQGPAPFIITPFMANDCGSGWTQYHSGHWSSRES